MNTEISKEHIDISKSGKNLSVTYIYVDKEIVGHNFFDNLTTVDCIIISSNVKKIQANYWECRNLKRFVVEEGNTVYSTIDGVLFSKDRKTLIAYPNMKAEMYDIPYGTEIIGSEAFKSCKNLKKLNIPDSVHTIGYSAFYRSGISKLCFHSPVNVTKTTFIGYIGSIDGEVIEIR